jgi:hypothetical protein
MSKLRDKLKKDFPKLHGKKKHVKKEESDKESSEEEIIPEEKPKKIIDIDIYEQPMDDFRAIEICRKCKDQLSEAKQIIDNCYQEDIRKISAKAKKEKSGKISNSEEILEKILKINERYAKELAMVPYRCTVIDSHEEETSLDDLRKLIERDKPIATAKSDSLEQKFNVQKVS